MSEQAIIHTLCFNCNKNRCSDRILVNGAKRPCMFRECALKVFGEINNEYYKIKKEENGYEV
jgi:hypothetical protein